MFPAEMLPIISTLRAMTYASIGLALMLVCQALFGQLHWTVVFLLLSLALTPARAVFDFMPLMQIRRRIGVAAALYAVLHLLIYAADQKWNLVVVAVEIAKRFYLTIGFVVLGYALYWAKRSQAKAITNKAGFLWQKFPKFVLGFIVISLMATVHAVEGAHRDDAFGRTAEIVVIVKYPHVSAKLVFSLRKRLRGNR